MCSQKDWVLAVARVLVGAVELAGEVLELAAVLEWVLDYIGWALVLVSPYQ